MADVAFGSIATFRPSVRDFRFTPINGHRETGPAGPVRAMNGLMQCNKPRAKINYRILEAKLVREIPRTERVEGLSPEEQDRIANTLLLETVVIDVDGLTEEDGTTPLKYTKDLGLQLLFDPDCKVFTAGCAYAGSVVAQRKKAAETTEGKN